MDETYLQFFSNNVTIYFCVFHTGSATMYLAESLLQYKRDDCSKGTLKYSKR